MMREKIFDMTDPVKAMERENKRLEEEAKIKAIEEARRRAEEEAERAKQEEEMRRKLEEEEQRRREEEALLNLPKTYCGVCKDVVTPGQQYVCFLFEKARFFWWTTKKRSSKYLKFSLFSELMNWQVETKTDPIHVKCLQCHFCSTNLAVGGEGGGKQRFMLRKGILWCVPCIRERSKQCAKCSGLIFGEEFLIVRNLQYVVFFVWWKWLLTGSCRLWLVDFVCIWHCLIIFSYHQTCLVCCYCENTLGTEEFYTLGTGDFVCVDCKKKIY